MSPQEATELIAHGYELIPVRITEDNKKIPLHRGWQTEAPLAAAEVVAYSYAGVRLAAHDLVIDIDPRNGGVLERVAGWHLFPRVKTRSGGWHLYGRLGEGQVGRLRHTVPELPGTEFKTLGRFVVAPGCEGYSWELDSPGLPAPAVPDSTVEMVIKQVIVPDGLAAAWSPGELAAALERLRVEEWRDHDRWFQLMCACHEATGGAGLGEFVAWSTGDGPYRAHANKIRSRWESLRAGKTGNAGAATLEHLLVEAGAAAAVAQRDFAGVAGDDDFGQLGENDGGAAGRIDELPDALMAKMGRWFKVVDESGKFRILAHRPDDILGRKYWVRYGRQDFAWVCKSVMHIPMVACGTTAKGDVRFEEASVHWLDHWRKKETYRGVVYAPEHDGDKTPDGRLNVWRGFAVDEGEGGSWEYLKELTWDTLCGGDTESYEYVMNWLARAAQRPWEPGGVAVVFKGIKGTGKTTLGSYFVRLFGQHGMTVTSPSLLTGRFNAHLRDISALLADEAFWAGDKTGEGVLKGLVTDGSITYEGKGTNAETGRNCVHIMMCSNEDWVVPAGLDGERRFAVFQVEPDKHGARYWAALRKEMADGGLARMLWDLRRRDLSRFDVFRVPQTGALADQKARTMEPCEAWLFDLLDSGRWAALPCVGRKPSGWPVVLATTLQDDMADFYRRHSRFKMGLESVERHLGMMLKKMVPSTVRVRVARPDDGVDGSGRPWAYILPREQTAREELRSSIGLDMAWDKSHETYEISGQPKEVDF